MKQLFKTGLLLGSLVAAAFMFEACSENSVSSDKNEEMKTGENFTFYKNRAMAEEAEANRSEEISDPFEINNVTIEDKNGQKLMHIDVTQTLGCEESYPDKFSVIWNGIMLLIYPPQVGFFLTFDSSGCPELEENVQETITLNLYEVFEDKEFVDEVAKFSVANASKTSQENDRSANSSTSPSGD